jgi:hypothetical protein
MPCIVPSTPCGVLSIGFKTVGDPVMQAMLDLDGDRSVTPAEFLRAAKACREVEAGGGGQPSPAAAGLLQHFSDFLTSQTVSADLNLSLLVTCCHHRHPLHSWLAVDSSSCPEYCAGQEPAYAFRAARSPRFQTLPP